MFGLFLAAKTSVVVGVWVVLGCADAGSRRFIGSIWLR